MKHRVAGRKLGRTSSHRLAVLRNLASELFEKEKIETTLMKAKELRPFAERLLTMAKRESLHARRRVLRQIHSRDVVAKMFDALSARYAQRPGGYTRILKLGPRRGDNAERAIIELVGAEIAPKPKESEAAPARAAAPKRARGKKAAPRKASKAPTAKKRAPKAKASTKAKGSGKASGSTRKAGKSGS